MENKNTPRKGRKNGMETLKQRRRNGYKDRKGSWKHEDKQGKMGIKTLRKRTKKVPANIKTNKKKMDVL